MNLWDVLSVSIYVSMYVLYVYIYLSPGGGHSNPLQYSCLENPYGQRSLAGYGSYTVSQRVGHNRSNLGCMRGCICLSPNSGRWWRTGKLGMLQSVGLQRVRRDLSHWATITMYLSKEIYKQSTNPTAINISSTQTVAWNTVFQLKEIKVSWGNVWIMVQY